MVRRLVGQSIVLIETAPSLHVLTSNCQLSAMLDLGQMSAAVLGVALSPLQCKQKARLRFVAAPWHFWLQTYLVLQTLQEAYRYVKETFNR